MWPGWLLLIHKHLELQLLVFSTCDTVAMGTNDVQKTIMTCSPVHLFAVGTVVLTEKENQPY